MSNKKPVTRNDVSARPFTKLDAATLQNMAHQSVSPAADNDAESVGHQPIADMLMKLSPSNLHLVENIIRVIVGEQSPESD